MGSTKRERERERENFSNFSSFDGPHTKFGTSARNFDVGSCSVLSPVDQFQEHDGAAVHFLQSSLFTPQPSQFNFSHSTEEHSIVPPQKLAQIRDVPVSICSIMSISEKNVDKHKTSVL